MGDRTAIEWTDATWNPIVGCSLVSPGCTHCYAMRLAGTRLKHHPSRKGLTVDTKAGPVWTGEMRFNETVIDDPFRWRRPRLIFVCAHGDLFAAPFGWIMRVFLAMGMASHHTYQIPTKRPERMREFFRLWCDVNPEEDWDFKGARGPDEVRKAHSSGRGRLFADMLEAMGPPPAGCAYPLFDWAGGMSRWPDALPNVWLGVSVEDQKRADERIPLLLDTPATIRFVSAEPLLGPVQVTPWLNPDSNGTTPAKHVTLDWVICGGESGPGARPMHPDWARSLRDQCQATGRPFFFKQWGEWEPIAEWQPWDHRQQDAVSLDGSWVSPHVAPQDVGGHRMRRVGKKTAGAMLDGREWREFPGRARRAAP